MSWSVCGIINKNHPDYTFNVDTKQGVLQRLWILTDVCATKITFNDLNGESCGDNEACSGVDITVGSISRRWHYSLLSHTEMVISIEKSHIVFIGGDNPLAIPLPERMSLITNTIIDEYELKLLKLTKENQKLKEEIQSILRGSSSNILSEEEIDFPDQVDSLFRQSSEDTIINEDSIRHFDAEGEPWSLIECVESVFIPGTVHYLSTGLLVNSLSNSHVPNDIRDLVFSKIKDQLHVSNKNKQTRTFAISCLQRFVRKKFDTKYLNSFWKECAKSWEYQPYHSITYQDIEIGDLIGEGTFGKVYKGTWIKSESEKLDVAIKFITESLQLELTDLRNEFIALSILDHKNLMTMHGAGFYTRKVINSETMTWFIVMDEMKCSLHDLIYYTPGGLSIVMISKIALEMAEGLQFLHSCNIIHRDIKPENILIDFDDITKIADLGIIKATTGTLSKTVIGTNDYMAPELKNAQVSHIEYSPNIDVFSYGAVLWEMITRTKLSSCIPQTKLKRKKYYAAHPIPGDCPHYLAQILKACTSYAPSKRTSFEKIITILKRNM